MFHAEEYRRTNVDDRSRGAARLLRDAPYDRQWTELN
jgi:hypothetical protein